MAFASARPVIGHGVGRSIEHRDKRLHDHTVATRNRFRATATGGDQ
jgi:hypothetical protein